MKAWIRSSTIIRNANLDIKRTKHGETAPVPDTLAMNPIYCAFKDAHGDRLNFARTNGFGDASILKC